MTPSNPSQQERLKDFITELSGFAIQAEQSLNRIESGGSGAETDTSKEFRSFSQHMIAIRGTAQQLSFPNIAHIAGLGEEISIKASSSTSPQQKRKCMSGLWDTLTTVKYMLEHPSESTGEEQQILVQRLESILKNLGGARPTVSENEIEALLKQTRG